MSDIPMIRPGEVIQRKQFQVLGKEVDRLTDEIERLRNLLMDVREKLEIYYKHGNKNYKGGVPYDVLMSQISLILGEKK